MSKIKTASIRGLVDTWKELEQVSVAVSSYTEFFGQEICARIFEWQVEIQAEIGRRIVSGQAEVPNDRGVT